jgi:lipopolysaccharide/colanic/teichoic acid biosynthesis glycosyltransferase
LKRCLDLSVSLAGLIVLAPLLTAIALAIWLADRHRPLFLGSRVARGGGSFRMIKFRTMTPHAWKSGVNSRSGDARITRIGRWLRKNKLDELPQLWNVFIGDMSLVGPLPQAATDAGLYTVEELRMLSIRPGVTDLASLVFADEGEILKGSADPDLLYNQVIRPWKSRLALLYVDRHSLGGDLRILWLTALASVSRNAALERIGRMLRQWGAGPLLLGMARRQEPLLAFPPPGAANIVDRYPGKARTA